MKKLKVDALMIKELLNKKYKKCDVSYLLKILKEMARYLVKHEIKTFRRKSKN